MMDDTKYDRTISELITVFLTHFSDFDVSSDQAEEMAVRVYEDSVDFESTIEIEQQGRTAQFNVEQIANAQSHLNRLRGAILKVKDDCDWQSQTGFILELDALDRKLKAWLAHWLQHEQSALRSQNPFGDIKTMTFTPSSAGRPQNTHANILAYILGHEFERITGKKPAITKGTYADVDARSGRYLSLVTAVFDIFEFTDANARSAAERAIQNIKKRDKAKN